MRRFSLFQVSLLLYVFLLPIHPGDLSAQVTPTITRANPADIVVGTPLGPAQLNATSSVDGTFIYNPRPGAVLPGGNGGTLSLEFFPFDTVNYAKASAFVRINVLEGRISGKLTNASGAPLSDGSVFVYNTAGAPSGGGSGVFVKPDGTYTFGGLPAGLYLVTASGNSGFIDQIYGGLSCPETCNILAGTTVAVSLGATTTNIDFALVERGRISGHMTGPGGGPLSSVGIVVYNASGNQAGNTTTDLNGAYTISGLAPGTYFARTDLFSSGLLGQLYSGVTCASSCNVTSGTPIKVTAGSTTPNINFALDVGGRISGKVIGSNGKLVNGASVSVYDASGVNIRTVPTDSNGNYIASGLVAGTYFAKSSNLSFSLQDQLPVLINPEQIYNGIQCQSCDITMGTPIPVTLGATTPNIDFVLTAGGGISGKVTVPNGYSPTSIVIQLQDPLGHLFFASVNSSGAYTVSGLAAGTYFARTSNGPLVGLVDYLYNGIPCQGCITMSGSPITVAAGVMTPNINFAVQKGGEISGTVTNTNGLPLSHVKVELSDASGSLVISTQDTFSDGTFSIGGLTAGTYFARTTNGLGYLDSLYSGAACALVCSVTAGTPIAVTLGTTTSNINFALANGGILSGKVTDDGGIPVSGVTVQLYDASGNFVSSVNMNNTFGTYSFPNLPPGTYFARAANSPLYIEQLFNRVLCTSSCAVTAGQPIAINAGATTSNINFVVIEGSRISGRVNLPGRSDMSGANVEIYNSFGILAATASTNAGGLYTVTGLPAGSYYARTRNSFGYVDQLYGGDYCVSCNVTTGAPIAVAFAATASNINFALAPSLTSISPASGGQGAIVSVTLTGTNFFGSMTINAGTGITVSDVVVLSPTSAAAKFSIASTAALGRQSVMVTLSGVNSNAVTFSVGPPVLSLSKTGSGAGTVVSSPPGIECGVTCTTPFTTGQVFALTAAPANGAIFAGWSGDADCVDGSVTMTAARNCVARFDLPQVNSTLLRGDYDGDGKTDIAVYRPSTGEWFLRLSTQNYVVAAGNWYFQWGIPGDVPLSGDFDGDGKTDIAVYRPSTGEWYLRLSTQGYVIAAGTWYFQWGIPGDVPITGDFDGDGKTDITVYRPSTGEWYSRLSTLGYAVAQGNWYFQWGIPGDQPVAGDFDGDGRTDIAAYRPSTGEWFIRLSTQGYAIASGNWYYQWGVSGDQPVAGDYDGDHKTDIAVYRPSTGEWLIRLSTLNYAIASGNWYFQWGIPGDVPVKGDFDGDAESDIAVYRPSSGEWYLRLSAFGYAVAQGNWYFQWGVPGDLPQRR